MIVVAQVYLADKVKRCILCPSISNYGFNTRSNDCPFTAPPPIDDRTFRLNPSLLDRKSSAASLFKGSEAFGSRKRNWGRKPVSMTDVRVEVMAHDIPESRKERIVDLKLASSPLVKCSDRRCPPDQCSGGISSAYT
jgi:hypothetical protein